MKKGKLTPAAEALRRIEKRWSGCKRCPLCKTRGRVVFWRGHPSARLAIVGEAPGENEDREGRPFVGDAGDLLEELCAVYGGPEPWSYFLANTVGCQPPMNRNPLEEEWIACRPRLYGMLTAVNPRAILLLGGTALRFLTGRSKIMKLRGEKLSISYRWKSRQIEIPAIATIHPGYLLRHDGDTKLRQQVAGDIRKAWELADGPSWLEGD